MFGMTCLTAWNDPVEMGRGSFPTSCTHEE
jgi:hypothetical protein